MGSNISVRIGLTEDPLFYKSAFQNIGVFIFNFLFWNEFRHTGKLQKNADKSIKAFTQISQMLTFYYLIIY